MHFLRVWTSWLRSEVVSTQHRNGNGISIIAQICNILTLKKIVPNLVQLGDCRLEWRDKEPLALTLHESKAFERLERIGNLEINVDRKVFCEPRLDTACNL